MTPAESLGLTDLQFHMVQYMPEVFIDYSATFHAEMSKLLVDFSVEKLAIEAFRGSAKSAYMSKGLLSYCPTMRAPDGSYLLDKAFVFTQSGGPGSLAFQWMEFFKSLISGELDNQRLYQHDYGFKASQPWTQSHCRITRPGGADFEVRIQGKGGSTRGARDPKAIILLDDIQDAADQTSEAILTSDEMWLINDVYPMLLAGQPMRAIGQNLSADSIMSRIERMPSFKYVRFPIETFVGSGVSVWPGHYSDVWLEAQKRDMGIDRFNAEYNCVPMVSGNPIFRKDWFKTYDPNSVQWERIKNGYLYTVMGFDGADSKSEAACETAIIVVSATADADPDVYLRTVKHDHWTLKQAVGQLFQTARDIEVHSTQVESRVKEGNMGPYEEEIRSQEALLRESLNATYVRPTHDKVTRALYAQPIIQRGKFHYNPQDQSHVAFVTQMCMFTGTQRFPADMVDAGVHALTQIKEHSGKSTKRVTGGIVAPHAVAQRDEHTGILL